MNNIPALNTTQACQIQEIIDNKTKPLGSLGMLETLAKQLALIQYQREGSQVHKTSTYSKLTLTKPTMLVFSGDHGINEEGVSIASSDVTSQMVVNFLSEGAAINCFCRINNIAMAVVDCGMLSALDKNSLTRDSSVEFFEQRLGDGTENFTKQAAMSLAQVDKGLFYGQRIIDKYRGQGCEVILLGEMGIANTSSASALMASLTPFSVEQCVGRGTGISDQQWQNKINLIIHANRRVLPVSLDRLTKQHIKLLLCEFGGFEIVQMVGAILSAAKHSMVVVIDGFIVSVAALVASHLNVNVIDYLVFAHVSDENGHKRLLSELKSMGGGQPLLNLGLRLGEGSGAALALPLLQAAMSFYNDMESFESAGVTV